MNEKRTRPDETEIDLRQYMSILWKGKWIIILCTLLAVAIGFALIFILPPVYEATTKVLIIEKNISSEVFDQYIPEYSGSREVNFQTQMEIIDSRKFREEVIRRLSLEIKPDELEDKIQIKRVRGTNVIDISTQDNDPRLAADIANILSEIYIEWVSENYQQGIKELLTEIDSKAIDSKENLDDASEEISKLEESGRDIPESLRKELEMYSSMYVMLSEKYENLKISETIGDSFAKTIETAVVPEESIKPSKKLYLAASFLIGLLLGCGIILLKEALDNAIKTSSDVKRYYGLNTISQIAYDKSYDTKKRELIVLKEPDSHVSESIRELRTNLGYFNIDSKSKTIGITSSQLEEGKSFISANLAVSMAQSGVKTLLINADFRKPIIHKYFNFNNNSGITSILTGHSKLSEEVRSTEVENLHFLASGPIPPNPVELLGSDLMGNMLEVLSEKYDYVIIDTPPIVPVTDLVVLARKIDSILVVARAGKVTRSVALQAVEKMEVVKGKVLGVVLNGVVRKESYYYYYK
ncbi:MAG: polysaccharide biosynthesis tyrosine autokinase [Actinomycetia bacterium]|nr:polysaccharide biosynthesis tyrosine autokinase [Actinomycetes bacterium]